MKDKVERICEYGVAISLCAIIFGTLLAIIGGLLFPHSVLLYLIVSSMWGLSILGFLVFIPILCLLE